MKERNIEQIIDILKPFKSVHEPYGSEYFTKILAYKGYLYATNRQILARHRAPKKHGHSFKKAGQDLSKIIHLDNTNLVININKGYVDGLKVMKKPEIEIECEECNGFGEVRWNYESKTDSHEKEFGCPVCDDNGVALTLGEEELMFPDGRFNINGSQFSIELFSKITDASEKIGEKLILTYQSKQNNRAIQIKCGSFKFIIMPMVPNSKHKHIIDLTDKLLSND